MNNSSVITGSTICILGGGQLGKMSLMAGGQRLKKLLKRLMLSHLNSRMLTLGYWKDLKQVASMSDLQVGF